MIYLIPSINDVSSIWAAGMIRAVWQGAIALSIAWLICHAMPRLPGRLRCWLWRAAYLKLLIALAWATPINLPLLRASPAAAPAVPSPAVHRAVDPPVVMIADIASPAAAPHSIVDRPIAAPMLAMPAVVAETPRLSVGAMLLGLWMIGVLFGCVQVASEWLAACRLRAAASPISDAQLMGRLRKLAARMGLRRLPPILSSQDAPGPLLTGQFRPVVILPTALLQECSISRIEIAAAHELAHLRRHDLLWCWLARLGRILFFFHPVVLLTQRDWREAQESACDEAAVAATGIRPADYGDALLYIISMSSFPRQRALALGIADSRKNLERRLLAMKHFTSTLRHRWALGVTFLCAIVVGLVPFRVTAQTPAAPVTNTHQAAGTQPSQDPTAAVVNHAAGPSTMPTAAEFARVDPAMASLVRNADELELALADAQRTLGESYPSVVEMRHRLERMNEKIEAYRKDLNERRVIMLDPDGKPQSIIRRPWPMNGVVEGVSVKIAPQIAGVIKEAHCMNGQQVRKGDVLVQLSDTGQQVQVAAAQVVLAQTKLVLARQQKMLESKATGVEDVEKAKMDVEIGQIRIKLAEGEAAQDRIIAPIDGIVIDARNVVEGQPVQSGEKLAVVLNVDTLTVRGQVPADSVAMVKVEQKVAVTWGHGPDNRLDGTISFISPQIDPPTGTVTVEVLVQNPKRTLRPGATVAVTAMPEK